VSHATTDGNKRATIARMLLSPQDVLKKGFRFFNGLPNDFPGPWTERRTNDFKSHYGSSPVVLANQWYDLMTTELHVGLTEADKSDKGFKMFLIVHHFLWAYPKNAKILGSAFSVCERLVQGENLRRWVRMIAALKAIKILWPEEEYNNQHGQFFIVSVDGTDFKVWEKKHPTMPIDKGQYSHKFNHGGLKYEIAIDVYRSKVVWISGPHRAGMHDKTVYAEMGLRNKIPHGKKVITDRVYGSQAEPEHHIKLALPNPSDNKELANFKARVRARHESFNGRLKFYRSLSDTYHHPAANHVHVFEAVCVTVQYQMDNGAELFAA
jgi:hypothetical protein